MTKEIDYSEGFDRIYDQFITEEVYAEVAPRRTFRLLKAYCSSPSCSDGRRLRLKAKVWTDRPPQSIYYSRPFECPDCQYALFWKKVHRGCVEDPILP